MTAQELFNKYNGKTVGTNAYDTGECVGWYNVGIREQLGIGGYVIQGAVGACQILTAKNTRPDLVQQVVNNPSDPNQVPSAGDWVIWGGNLPNSGGYGHVALFMEHPPRQMITADQNWGGKTVHKVTHDWNYVIGWIHLVQPAPIIPPVDPTIALNAKIVELNNLITAKDKQIADLTTQVEGYKKQVIDLQKQIDILKAQVGDSTKWQTLGVLLKELLGLNK